MMKISQLIVIKRWKPILEEYKKIRNKVALSWFKQIYNFEFEKILSDNGLRI